MCVSRAIRNTHLIFFGIALGAGTVHADPVKKKVQFHDNGQIQYAEVDHAVEFHRMQAPAKLTEPLRKEEAEHLDKFKRQIDQTLHYSKHEEAVMQRDYVRKLENGEEPNYQKEANQKFRETHKGFVPHKPLR